MSNPNFIISAGCSFTQYPTDANFSNWPGHLAKILGCEERSKFLGKPSVDNSYVANSILECLSKLENYYEQIILGVMWSGVSRKSFFLKKPPENFYIPNIQSVKNPTHVVEDAKNYYLIGPYFNDNFSKLFYTNFYDEIGCLIDTIKNMLLVQNFCKLNRIKYFFSEYSYDTVSTNSKIHDTDVSYFYNLLDKSNFLPVENMSHWIDNHTNFEYNKIGDHIDMHPTTEMSEAFTHKIIIPYLKNKEYIS